MLCWIVVLDMIVCCAGQSSARHDGICAVRRGRRRHGRHRKDLWRVGCSHLPHSVDVAGHVRGYVAGHVKRWGEVGTDLLRLRRVVLCCRYGEEPKQRQILEQVRHQIMMITMTEEEDRPDRPTTTDDRRRRRRRHWWRRWRRRQQAINI